MFRSIQILSWVLFGSELCHMHSLMLCAHCTMGDKGYCVSSFYRDSSMEVLCLWQDQVDMCPIVANSHFYMRNTNQLVHGKMLCSYLPQTV